MAQEIAFFFLNGITKNTNDTCHLSQSVCYFLFHWCVLSHLTDIFFSFSFRSYTLAATLFGKPTTNIETCQTPFTWTDGSLPSVHLRTDEAQAAILASRGGIF